MTQIAQKTAAYLADCLFMYLVSAGFGILVCILVVIVWGTLDYFTGSSNLNIDALFGAFISSSTSYIILKGENHK